MTHIAGCAGRGDCRRINPQFSELIAFGDYRSKVRKQQHQVQNRQKSDKAEGNDKLQVVPRAQIHETIQETEPGAKLGRNGFRANSRLAGNAPFSHLQHSIIAPVSPL
jgi:hypothetical protein